MACDIGFGRSLQRGAALPNRARHVLRCVLQGGGLRRFFKGCMRHAVRCKDATPLFQSSPSLRNIWHLFHAPPVRKKRKEKKKKRKEKEKKRKRKRRREKKKRKEGEREENAGQPAQARRRGSEGRSILPSAGPRATSGYSYCSETPGPGARLRPASNKPRPGLA